MGILAGLPDRDQKDVESLNKAQRPRFTFVCTKRKRRVLFAIARSGNGASIKRAFNVDYLYYILAILVIGLIAIFSVRIATRSRNPDLIVQYEARKKAVRKLSAKKKNIKADSIHNRSTVMSARDRNVHLRTPWGWPGSHRETDQESLGITETVKSFTDRLVREKQLVESGGLAASAKGASIRALLEDRYHPVDRSERAIPYQKVKRPLLRDPNEPHDQLDNRGSVDARKLRKKLQFLSAMNNEESQVGSTGSKSKVEFRYVDLKDLKQPWGW
jgi:hypothetical protein